MGTITSARTGRATVGGTVLVVAAAALFGGGALAIRSAADEQDTAPPSSSPAGDRDRGGDEPALPEDRLSATSRPRPEPERTEVPESGPGTFRTAAGGSEPAGRGTVYRYRVQIEDGIDLDPEQAAQEIQAILAHPRGWTNDGRSGFQLTDRAAAADFTVQIATPATVDGICGEWGLDTGGEVNCRVGDLVVVNLRRWVEGSPQFPGPITEYRALIINHEVGHRLGHGHAGCPAEGALAPVMMQQIKGLDGCRANAWPYDSTGAYIDGPWVP
ncbi:DUF3152 domain-containing protein [Streptomyces aidingensis]|uniref:DUF3152 domain-containing protein n=1 Tax=Streptomyces aidingensis TaxID=910347 RepID=A0A1I1E627_9ACTN|nr:DUF3152 domain-containing protein [Streptomyces aidingensis]SFB80738.1 Protein of unknown function [Streptomyces aidingensis]